jgi:hypothetical protein
MIILFLNVKQHFRIFKFFSVFQIILCLSTGNHIPLSDQIISFFTYIICVNKNGDLNNIEYSQNNSKILMANFI